MLPDDANYVSSRAVATTSRVYVTGSNVAALRLSDSAYSVLPPPSPFLPANPTAYNSLHKHCKCTNTANAQTLQIDDTSEGRRRCRKETLKPFFSERLSTIEGPL